jgi:hypothetical protein
MVELLVVMTLLSLIVLALMAVFNSTQQAFRASVTQTDVLEGSRNTVDLITADLRGLTPSDGSSNYIYDVRNGGTVNFFATNNDTAHFLAYAPLVQPLPGSNMQRTNLLQWFFVLGRVNTKWTGAGYVVNSGSASPLYPLYRFYAETNISANPVGLFSQFVGDINALRINPDQATNLSHVMDGVVHFVVRAYDPNGYQLTNTVQYKSGQLTTNRNIWFSAPQWGEAGFCMFSNVVPAAVELQLGVLEDRALERAGSLPFQSPAQLSYLAQQAGKIHLFRQRVTIPNVDPSAYLPPNQ